MKSAIAKNEQSSERLRKIEQDKSTWGDSYLKPSKGRFQTILCGADIHDKLCDPFYRRLFIDTVKRAQPNKVVLNGDTFEMYELSKYGQDVRKMDLVGSIRWVHAFLQDLRTASPSSEIVMISGNHDSRLIKFIYETSPALIPLLHELHNMDFKKLLGLDKFEVNFISKESLQYAKETDLKNEIKKNYYLAYDTVLFHHFPHAKDWGYAGVNGHHHRHLVDHRYSATKGPYEWHQIGGGHVRQAGYCEGEIWQNGFIMCHVDTHKKYSQFEYIDCTGEHCVIGGKWYQRSNDEIVKVLG